MPCRPDPLHPEALVAAEQQRVAVGGDVFDVGGADAADLRFHFRAVALHRVDVGVGGRALAALAAAVEDAAGEVARLELVDSRCGSGGSGRHRWGGPSRDRRRCRSAPLPLPRTKTIARPSGEKSASWSSAAPRGQRRERRRRWRRPCRGRPGPRRAPRRSKTTERPSGETIGAESSSGPLVSAAGRSRRGGPRRGRRRGRRRSCGRPARRPVRCRSGLRSAG